MRIFFSLLLALWLPMLAAHAGHDHGEAAAISTNNALAPYFESTAGGLELLGRLQDERLHLWLDHWDSNAPLAGAQLIVESGNWRATAVEIEPGLYRAEAQELTTPGHHALMIFIQAAGIDEILIASLEVDAPEQTATSTTSWPWLWLALAGLLALTLVAVWTGSRHRLATMSLPLLLLLSCWPYNQGHAHAGHDHGAAPVSVVNRGDIPNRMPDGGLFLPKASQHLLSIRTLPVVAGELSRSVELQGRVIPDANASSTVQAPRAGRLSAAIEGLPVLGQSVQQGQLLAYLQPLAAAVDLGERAAQLADVKGALEVAERQLRRLEGMRENIAEKELDAAAVAVRSLRQQGEVLNNSLYQLEKISAPSAGVISISATSVGQVVTAGDVLFEVIQPQRLWVEALAYDINLAAQIRQVNVRLVSGAVIPAQLLGVGSRMRQQTVTVLFALQPPLPPIAVAEKITVIAELNDKLTGVAVPRAAVTRGPMGETRVWLKQSAEHYTPQRVTIAPLDGSQVAVVQGLQGGERIVVQGAALLDQIH